MDLPIISVCDWTALLAKLPAFALVGALVLVIILVATFALGVVFQRVDCSAADDVALRERRWPDDGPPVERSTDR